MMTQPEVPVNTSQSNLRILWLPAFLCALLLSAEIYFLLHDWDSLAHPKTATPTESIAIYVSGKKTVRQKPVGTLIWKEPVPNMELFRESEIATTDDSEAVLRFHDQSELIVEPNSLLILEEAPSAMKTGSNGKIIARLVRGSVKRKSTGTQPFFVKLSTASDAPAVQIQSPSGGSVFRVIYRAEGYEIVVESGSVVVDQKTVKAGEQMNEGQAPRLSAPILKKPKVNVVQPHSQIFWNWLIPSAEAAGSKISIQFAWEETPDAKEYLIQIARDPEFSDILLEKKVSGLEYDFEMPAPETKTVLYFHVAGISASEVIGNFSSLASVDVNPIEIAKPKPSPTPVASTEPMPAPTPKATVKPKKTAEKIEKKTEEPLPPLVVIRTGNSGWLWYEARFQNRKFKSDSNPKVVSSNGFVPTGIGFEFQHAREPGHFYSIGGSFFYESGKADLPTPSDASFSTSQIDLWLTYGQLWNERSPQRWQIGPYLSTSKKIIQNGLKFESENLLLLGAVIAIQNDPTLRTRDFHWRAQLALLGIGTVGADLSAWIRKPIPFLAGTFWGLKANARLTGVETGLGGGLQVGLEL